MEWSHSGTILYGVLLSWSVHSFHQNHKCNCQLSPFSHDIYFKMTKVILLLVVYIRSQKNYKIMSRSMVQEQKFFCIKYI